MNKAFKELKALRSVNSVLLHNDKEITKSLDIIWKTLIEAQKNKIVIEIIKKHFIIEFQESSDKNGILWARLVSFQSKEDEGDYDTTACANLVNFEEDFKILKKVLGNE